MSLHLRNFSRPAGWLSRCRPQAPSLPKCHGKLNRKCVGRLPGLLNQTLAPVRESADSSSRQLHDARARHHQAVTDTRQSSVARVLHAECARCCTCEALEALQLVVGWHGVSAVPKPILFKPVAFMYLSFVSMATGFSHSPGLTAGRQCRGVSHIFGLHSNARLRGSFTSATHHVLVVYMTDHIKC